MKALFWLLFIYLFMLFYVILFYLFMCFNLSTLAASTQCLSNKLISFEILVSIKKIVIFLKFSHIFSSQFYLISKRNFIFFGKFQQFLNIIFALKSQILWRKKSKNLFEYSGINMKFSKKSIIFSSKKSQFFCEGKKSKNVFEYSGIDMKISNLINYSTNMCLKLT
jgi:hypothetical protein